MNPMSQGQQGVIMVATLGFGIDFIVRRLADLKHEKIKKIIVVGLYTDEPTWQRIEQTYSILRAYLASQGIGSSLEKIDLGKGRLVKHAREIIAKALAEAGDEKVELYLTGGPRILLASFYTAAITLSREWAEKIRIAVYGEGFPASLEVETSKLLILASLDKTSRRILEYINDGYNDIHSLLEATGLPRSTLYKKLKDLEDLGLIARTGRGQYQVHSTLEQIL